MKHRQRVRRILIGGMAAATLLVVAANPASAYPYGGGRCRNTNNTWSYWYTNSNSDSTSVVHQNLSNGNILTSNGTGTGFHSGLNTSTIKPLYVVDNVTSQTTTLTDLGRC